MRWASKPCAMRARSCSSRRSTRWTSKPAGKSVTVTAARRRRSASRRSKTASARARAGRCVDGAGAIRAAIDAGGLTDANDRARGIRARAVRRRSPSRDAGRARMLPSISANMLVLGRSAAPGTALGGAPVPPSFTAVAARRRPAGASDGRRSLRRGPTPPRRSAASPAPGAVPAAGAPGSAATMTAVEETAVGDGLIGPHRRKRRRDISSGTVSWTTASSSTSRTRRWVFAGRDDAAAVVRRPSVRIRQIATAPIPIVRVALTLTSSRQVDVVNTGDGLAVAVERERRARSSAHRRRRDQRRA